MDYTQWKGQKWQILSVGEGVDDLAKDDIILFELDGASPPRIEIASVVCPHSGSPHTGNSWKVKCSGSGTIIQGTKELDGVNFWISNSKDGAKEKLTTVARPVGAPSTSGQTSGGVCWTAEDGGGR